METIKESLKEDIKRLAWQNLDKEPVLMREKEKLGVLYEDLNKAREEYNQFRRQYGRAFSSRE